MIADTFVRDGARCHVRKRAGLAVLVELPFTTLYSHWEVMQLRQRKARKLPNGRTLPAGLAMPSTSEWGKFGWSFTDRVHAEEKFKVIAAKRPTKLLKKVA